MENLVENQFKRISYTEAIDILKKDYKSKSSYEKIGMWGCDLNSEQEKCMKKLAKFDIYEIYLLII